MIYDDSVLCRERYFVRLYIDSNDVLHGSVSDAEKVRWFTQKGKLIWEEEEKIHGFDGVPATEYVENKERTCIFEPAISMIDAYNKAISEKANDVDYFADAYMKVLGSRLDDDDLEHIRDKRIINLEGDADTVIVDFLQKPNGDTTQENLIDRLEKLIFQISMVANISDENFGTSSGIAMKYKLQGMSNLAKTKERKFTSGMNRRYKLIFSNPVSGMKEDDWVKLHYHFTPNIPSNVLEESQIAGNLDGIVSQETQLGVLSVVDNVQNEMEKIESEQEKAKTDPVMTQMFGGAGDGKANMNKQMKQLLEESEPETIIAIHNHPGSSVPSLADLMTCVKRGYNFGLVACHDGKVYKYWVDKNKFNSVNAGFALDRMETQGYDKEVRTWLEQAGVYLEVW